jgi:hypothetical protein
VAGRHRAPPGRGGGHRHARGRGLPGAGDERLRHRRQPQQRAGGGLHRPAGIDDPRRGRGGAGARGQPRGQRRHGDHGPAAGRAQHLRDRAGAGGGPGDRRLPVRRPRRPGPGLLRDRVRARPGLRPVRQHDRHVVLAAPRVPGRFRRRRPGRQGQDDRRPAAPEPHLRREHPAQAGGRVRHQRRGRPRPEEAADEPPAAGAADRGAAQCPARHARRAPGRDGPACRLPRQQQIPRYARDDKARVALTPGHLPRPAYSKS